MGLLGYIASFGAGYALGAKTGLVAPGTERVAGIITDRDIAIRAVAEGRDTETTTKVRRLPVVEADRAVGIVSLGDLAIETNLGSALAEISAAAPDR